MRAMRWRSSSATRASDAGDLVGDGDEPGVDRGEFLATQGARDLELAQLGEHRARLRGEGVRFPLQRLDAIGGAGGQRGRLVARQRRRRPAARPRRRPLLSGGQRRLRLRAGVERHQDGGPGHPGSVPAVAASPDARCRRSLDISSKDTLCRCPTPRRSRHRPSLP